MEILELLDKWEVDFAKKGHNSYKFESGGFMDLVVEVWQQDEWTHVSVAHYYLQNGDLMSDPEIEFRIHKQFLAAKEYGDIQVVSYTQHGLGIYQEALVYIDGKLFIKPKLQKSIKSFLKTWANNLQNQGYRKKIEEGEEVKC